MYKREGHKIKNDSEVTRREWAHRHDIWAKVTIQGGCIAVPIVTTVFLMSVGASGGLRHWHIAVAAIVIMTNMVAQIYFWRHRRSLFALLISADIGLTSIVGLITLLALLDWSYDRTLFTEGFEWLLVTLGVISGISPFFLSRKWSLKQSKIRALFERGRAPSYEVMEAIFFRPGKSYWWRPGFYAGGSITVIGIFALARQLGIQDTEEFQAYLALLLIVIGYPFLLSSLIVKWSRYYPLFRRKGDVTID